MPDDPTALPVVSSPSDGEFGQEYSLLNALHKLVRDYPLGVGLFKEFIQNADDAEAEEVRFILDKCSYADFPFHHPSLKVLAEPALLIWNDQPFKPQDIENIKNLGDSQKVKKPSNTGKFGLGFNTCYNITDYPLLLTGGSVYLFDPHKEALDYRDGSSPGHFWSVTPHRWAESPGLLEPFRILGLSPSQNTFAGAAFRLPLRTKGTGKIKPEPVAVQKIAELIREFEQLAPSILLFLKHVLRIEFLVASGPDKPPSSVISIETTNEAVVRAGRNRINALIQADLPATLEHLGKQDQNKLQACFKHSVKVVSAAGALQYDWLVSAGLFRGENDALLKTARELWERAEKVLPWAGVAGLLPADRAEKQPNVTGEVFCFLPLPDVRGTCRLPVHLNGFFDVNTSRRGLTHESSARDSIERLRGRWNQELLEHAVAPAYAHMLVHLLEIMPAIKPEDFYHLWLDPKQDFPRPLDSFGKALYQQLAKHPLLRSAAGAWVALSALRLVDSELLPALVAEGWDKIPNPEIPRCLLDGISLAQAAIPSLTSAEVRQFFQASEDVNCKLSESSHPALRSRDWLIKVATFAFQEADPSDFVGLPLLLLADGKLHTFGRLGHAAFLAGEAERDIFVQFPEWFVDADYVVAAGLIEVPGCEVLRMTPEQVLQFLARVLPRSEGKECREWIPSAPAPPNEAWLLKIFKYFLSQTNDWTLPEDLLVSPCLVPDQHHRLWPCNLPTTPLYLPTGLAAGLRQALKSLDVQVLHGGAPLLKAVESFAERFDCIWPVTPRDLADTLHSSVAVWSPKLSRYSPGICDPVLQFFASAEGLQSFKSEQDDRSDKISQLPIFPCQNDELVAISEHQCFIATDVQPPAVPLPIKLLRPGSWNDLLIALHVAPLGVRAIIEKILLPHYASLSSSEQSAALAWIRDRLEAALTEAGEESDQLLESLRASPLVLGSDGQLHVCCHLYLPNDETIKNVFGGQAITPNPSLYELDWKRWLPFFERLGINKTPRPQDLASYISKLAHTDPVTELIEQQLASLLHHVVDHWSELREGKVSLGGESPIAFKEFLRGEQWCPPLRGSQNLRHLLVALDPPLQLFRLAKLYPPSVGHLVASQGYLLPLRAEQREGIPAAIRELIPEVVSPSLPVVAAHFSKLLARLSDPNPPDKRAIRAPLQRIYSYFGKVHRRSQVDVQPPDEANPAFDPVRPVDDSEFESAQRALADIDCIYVESEDRFRKPKDVFKEPVPYASPWWSQSYFGDSQVEAGLAFLGRKEKPDLADLCRLTCEICAAQENGLSQEEASQFIRILYRIEELLPENGLLPALCLLDRDDCPVPRENLYFQDAIWLDDKLIESPVHLHHPQLPPKLIDRLKLRRLSEHLHVEPESEWPESQNAAFVERCQVIESLLKSPEFSAGLRRILLKESHLGEPSDLAWLAAIQVRPYQSLECLHYIMDGDTRHQIAKAEELFFHDELESGAQWLAVSEAASEVFCEQIAIAIQRILRPGLLHDLSPLTKILQYPRERLESILDKLRIPRLSEAAAPEGAGKETEAEKSGFFEADKTGEAERPQAPTGPAGGSAPPAPAGAGASGGGSAQPGGTSAQPAGSGYGGGSSRSGWRRPGSGGRRRSGVEKPQPQPKGRLLSYPATAAQKREYEHEEDQADDELPANRVIGDWAVHWVLQYELQCGRNPDASSHIQNGPGYDVLSRGKAFQHPRYIEVKGIETQWDLNGAPVTPRQFDFAREKGDQFWLYVVEFATESSKVKIHTIQNPVAKITQYRFDNGWAREAVQEQSFVAREPAVGMRIQWRNKEGKINTGVILGVGKLLQVELDNQLHTRTGVPNKALSFELLSA